MNISRSVRRPFWAIGLVLVAGALSATQLPELAFADDTRSNDPVVQQAASAPSPVATLSPDVAPVEVEVPPVRPAAVAVPAGPAAVVAAPAATKPVAPKAVAPVAPASSTCAGTGWEQRRGAAALASLRPAPMGGYALSFHPAMSGFLGLTKPATRVVEVYVRSCSAESDALLRHVVAHELGHAWDKTRLSDAQRAAWLAARGIPAGTSWQGCNRCADFATPAGDFAEVYAQWRTGESTNRSKLAGAPSPAQLNALAAQFFGG